MIKMLALALVMIGVTSLQNPSETCSLPAPSDNGSTHNGTSITFQWTAVTGASGYNLTVTDLSTSTVIFNGSVSGLSQNISGTNPTTNYRARIAPKCGDGEESTNIIVVDVLGV